MRYYPNIPNTENWGFKWDIISTLLATRTKSGCIRPPKSQSGSKFIFTWVFAD